MNELIVNSVLRLLALFSSSKKGEELVLIKKYVENYLTSSYGRRIGLEKHVDFVQYLILYEKSDDKITKIKELIDLINEEHLLKDRIRIYITLLNFIRYMWNLKTGYFLEEDKFSNKIDTIAAELHISQSDSESIKQFVFNQLYRIPNKENLLLIGQIRVPLEVCKFAEKQEIQGHISVLYVANGNLMLLQYNGRAMLEINRKIIFPNQLYTITPGAFIGGMGIKPIYYGELLALILQDSKAATIYLSAKNLEYTFGNSDKGIHQVSLACHTGEMVAIMGDSGVGKSTLLNILAGLNLKYKGTIHWNGLDYKDETARLRDLMGFITQEDSLIEDLTVYDNIYFSSRLSLGNISDKKLRQLVDSKLEELGLFEIKDLIVGTLTNRVISGGQRKRLSIAIELMREPKVLFVDEPTSGLSSADSEKVMNTLKTLTSQGILIIVNIHQPSSEIFKLFDQLLILDKGGVIIYYGNPLAGILHFKEAGNWVDKNVSVCESCGNVKPEVIFDIIGEKKVNEFGEPLDYRKISPQEFQALHLSIKQEEQQSEITAIPKAKFSPTSAWLQFKLFLIREIAARMNSREFLLFSITVPLLLSIIIATVSKKFVFSNVGIPSYNVFQNQNIPSFFFMAVIACMFIGLIISADGVFRNKKTQTREKYVKLNVISYLRSKVVFFICLSLFQTLLFTAISIWILDLRGVFLSLWITLFSVSSVGNIAGLFVSANFKSIAGIYLAIPFLFLPQILLSGVVVNFDQLYYRLSSQKVVPVIGDIMASRWAYEAIIVSQFTKNSYEMPLFESEMTESRLRNGLLYLIPLINEERENLLQLNSSERIKSRDFTILTNAIKELNANMIEIHQPLIAPTQADDSSLALLAIAVEDYNKILSSSYNKCIAVKEQIIEEQMRLAGGSAEYLAKRNHFQNEAIVALVRNRSNSDGVKITKESVSIMVDPIFQYPSSNLGRAQLYAPFKRLGTLKIDTFYFNIAIIWAMAIVGYLAIIFSSTVNIKRFREKITLQRE